MAPAISSKSVNKSEPKVNSTKFRKLLSEVRDHVEKNFDDVGDQFPEEARKIYYGESEARDIYGNASDEEAEDLVEEGVPVGRLPWIKRPNS